MAKYILLAQLQEMNPRPCIVVMT